MPTAMGHNPGSGATVPGASLVFFTDNEAVNNAYGAFLQGDYSFNDHWKLTAGKRVEYGYDHFTLMKQDGQWRIVNLVFYGAPAK